jgi:hypothetical protein
VPRKDSLPVAYRADCAELKKTESQTSGPGIAALWPALLADGAVPDLKDLLKGEDDGFVPFFRSMNLRLALWYRLGRDEDVETWFLNAASQSRADHYFLAMAQHRRGKSEARATLEKANAMTAEPAGRVDFPSGIGFTRAVPPTGGWQLRVLEEILRKEAEGLILGKE